MSLLFSALGIKPRVFLMLDKCSCTESHYKIINYVYLFGVTLGLIGGHIVGTSSLSSWVLGINLRESGLVAAAFILTP